MGGPWRRDSARRWSWAALLLGVVVAVTGPAWACEPSGGVLQVSPESGEAGSQVTVAGQYFSGTTIDIRWGSDTGPLLGTATPPSFQKAVTVPNSPPGYYLIAAVAKDANGTMTSRSAVTYRVTEPPTTTTTSTTTTTPAPTTTVAFTAAPAPVPPPTSTDPPTQSATSESTAAAQTAPAPVPATSSSPSSGWAPAPASTPKPPVVLSSQAQPRAVPAAAIAVPVPVAVAASPGAAVGVVAPEPVQAAVPRPAPQADARLATEPTVATSEGGNWLVVPAIIAVVALGAVSVGVRRRRSPPPPNSDL